jgi:transcriptional regulator with XRE-family HTH domain
MVAELIVKREALELTQSEVGRLIGIEQSRMSKYERMERAIPLVDFARLCHLYGINPSQILKGFR